MAAETGTVNLDLVHAAASVTDTQPTGVRCRHGSPREMIAYAAFLLGFLANGLGALPALIAAHRFFAAADIAFRPAPLIFRLCATGAATGTAGAGPFLPGGRPRRFAGPCRA
jgi:hypothetical protein